MAGILTIHSSSDGGESSTMASLGNHSWVEYQPDPVKSDQSTTYGTWGNRKPPGLRANEEKGFNYTGQASRSVQLTDEQEKKFVAELARYEKMGDKGWSMLSPCSTFAGDAWGAATGEKLPTRTWGISNPDTLKKSIEKANKRDAAIAARAGAKQIGNPVLPCLASSKKGKN